MKRSITRAVAVLAIFVAGFGTLLAGFAGTAGAAGNPPWEPVANPPEAGSLIFYNAAGQQITGGNLSDNPIAAYVQGTTTLRSGDTKATLKAYTPVNGQPVGAWTGGLLSGSASTYPNASAPGSLGTSALPLYTGNSSLDNSLQTYISTNPNTDASTTDGYAGIYVLRLVTSGPGLGATTSYDSVDIQVTGSTWSVVYPAISPIATTTALSELPVSPQVGGTSVALNATVSPSTAPGTVQFEVGGVNIGSPVTVSGGTASISTTTLPVGTDALSAVFTPTTPAAFVLGYGGSTGTSSFVVTQPPAAATSTALGVNPTSSAAGTPVALTGTVSSSGSPLASGAGSVNFYDNGSSNSGTISSSSTLLGSAPVGTGGTATLNYGAFGQGAHNIVAQFAPANTATYNASTSANVLYTATAPAAAPDPQTINVTIPAGSITITTPYTPANPLSFGTAGLNSAQSAFVAGAPFGSASNVGSGVTITDTRADDQSWTASALVTNFTSTGGTINGQNLTFTGVTPAYITGNALQAGDVSTQDVTNTAVYPAGASGNDGLGGTLPHAFASAVAGTPAGLTAVDGSVNIYGNLKLTAPTSTPSGLYTATLTFTIA